MAGRVIVLMGSKSDAPIGQEIVRELEQFEVKAEMRIASAHKSPSHLLAILAESEAIGGPRVYVAIAGRSNALSGMADAAVAAPVVSCPPYSERYAGADVFSSLRMPSGVAPLTVLEPAAAALAAAKILAVADPALQERIARFQQSQTQRILDDDRSLFG